MQSTAFHGILFLFLPELVSRVTIALGKFLTPRKVHTEDVRAEDVHTEADEDEDSEMWGHFQFPELTPEEDAQLTITLQGGTPQQTTSIIKNNTTAMDHTDSAAKLCRIRAMLADIGDAGKFSASTSRSASAIITDNSSHMHAGVATCVAPSHGSPPPYTELGEDNNLPPVSLFFFNQQPRHNSYLFR